MGHPEHKTDAVVAVDSHTASCGKEHDSEAGSTPVAVGESKPAGTLNRDLKGRHMQMIAIGGSIGAGLFVGSGAALHAGGPASVVCVAVVGWS